MGIIQFASLDVHWNPLELPPGIGKLINLRHLYHDRRKRVLPKGLGKLVSLREIKETFGYKNELTVGHNDEEAFSLGDLKDLNNLRGSLWIKGLENVADVGEAKQAQLKKKKHVTWMRLDFFKDEGTTGIHDQQLMEGLEPSSNLEELIILNYQGTTMVPSWMMSLTNLRYLSMDFCRNCEHLPPLGKLPALESLSFDGMGVKRLVELKFTQMPKWEEWEEWDNRMISGDEDTIMPRLHLLESFGFDTAVEAQRAINAAHVEAESFENGIGVVKLTGRYSGAGHELLCESIRAVDQQDASGNKLLQDVGLWISQKIKDHFANQQKMNITLKYIGLGQPCEGDLQGLITQCAMYVQKGGPRMDPSQGCCNVIKYVDIPCVCKYISKEIEDVIDMDKVVHVADFCSKPLSHGVKCGSE
ncbi:hypothetical protein GH714_020149 [Hevea brasiliensis]|uniref:Uncharacterized protein n=1 Tax=Hevea brasiliensis TaxID=3981 RepID=A0A6A6LI17_HEVBR|nr:hypothetical protein GH714_020149 [Hevea brasiliensis]